MIVALPVGEQEEMRAMLAKRALIKVLAERWEARLGKTGFDTNPEGDNGEGGVTDYANAMVYETPATIRAKCAAILADRSAK